VGPPVSKQNEWAPRIISGTYRGLQRKWTFDPNRFRCSALAAEVADLWVTQTRSSGTRYSTAGSYLTSCRRFCRFVDTLPSADLASLYSEDFDMIDAIFKWRGSDMHLNSETRSQGVKHLFLLIRRAAREGKPLQSGLSELSASKLAAPTPSNVLDEFSNKERLDQVRVATADAARTEARIAVGIDLYERNEAFRVLVGHAFNGLAYRQVRDSLFADPDLRVAVETALGSPLPTHKDNVTAVVGAFASMVVPTTMELLSFQILLGWSTGLAPEQIGDIKVKDLTFHPNSLEWSSFKARASKQMDLVFEDPASQETWGTVGLMARSVDLTRLARELAPDVDSLWLVYLMGSHHKSLSVHRQTRNKIGLAQWIKHHNLEISLPHDLRRIRKAVKAVRAELSGSVIEAASPDQSTQVFNGHYLPVTTLISAAGRTIVRAQDRIFTRVIQGSPLVIPHLANDLSAVENTAPDAVMIALDVAEESAEERSLGVSACADPFDSPVAPPGAMCLSRPFACLRCPNAVIFKDHVPQVLVMGEFIESQRSVLHPAEFLARWGDDRDRVGAILNNFDEETVRLAQESVDAKRETLHLPLSAKVGY
jgi:hypothetical protein